MVIRWTPGNRNVEQPASNAKVRKITANRLSPVALRKMFVIRAIKILPVLPIVKKSLDTRHLVYPASDETTMATDSQDLKNAGLKITLPRLKILELLESSSVHHVSAEDVYKMLLTKGEEIGLATVYRVLTQFETAGLVVRHHFEGGHSVFELSSDNHHDHVVCVKCGRVEEFHDEEIETRQKVVAEKLGFELTDHNLNMYGLCTECR